MDGMYDNLDLTSDEARKLIQEDNEGRKEQMRILR